MSSTKKAVLLVATLGAVALLALTGVAQAAPGGGDTTEIGINLGREISGWAKALLLGMACLVGLPALGRRDLSQILSITAIVTVLGGFIFAGPTVTNVITSLWKTIGG
jgi:hypothetical protein